MLGRRTGAPVPVRSPAALSCSAICALVWSAARRRGQLDRLGRGAHDVSAGLAAAGRCAARWRPSASGSRPAARGPVGLGGDRDVGDHRAQQPLAVRLGGALGGPQLRAGRGRAPRSARARARAPGLFCSASSASASASSRSFCSQRVSRLRATSRFSGSQAWNARSARSGLIAGALDAQLDRAGRARAAVGDLVGGRERERDLLRRERLEQPAGDQLVDDGGLDRPAAGCRDVVGARVGALVVAALALVARATSSRRRRRSARSPGTALRPPAAGR